MGEIPEIHSSESENGGKSSVNMTDEILWMIVHYLRCLVPKILLKYSI